MTEPERQHEERLAIGSRLLVVAKQLRLLAQGHEAHMSRATMLAELDALETAIAGIDPTLDLDTLTQYANHFLTEYEKTSQHQNNSTHRT